MLARPGTLGYPNGITYLHEEHRLAVADIRGLWTIDMAAAQVAPIATRKETFVGGIDGLYAVGNNSLLAIQNGLHPHRVVRIALTRGARRVASVAVIASNLPELAEMTTAAVAGGEITVLAGSELVQLVSSGSAGD